MCKRLLPAEINLVTTVKPHYNGHQGDRNKCPYYRGVHCNINSRLKMIVHVHFLKGIERRLENDTLLRHFPRKKLLIIAYNYIFIPLPLMYFVIGCTS